MGSTSDGPFKWRVTYSSFVLLIRYDPRSYCVEMILHFFFEMSSRIAFFLLALRGELDLSLILREYME